LAPAVNLNHFRLLRVVGRGAFGKVRIVERKDTGLSFALKYIRKDEGTPSIPNDHALSQAEMCGDTNAFVTRYTVRLYHSSLPVFPPHFFQPLKRCSDN
jgi:serine/threonine protein kinase